MDKPAPTPVPLHDLVRRRWSPLAFADRPVSGDDLAAVLEAARWAPSSYNEQPWRYIVARREDAAAHERLVGCLVPANQAWARHAGVLLLSVAAATFARNGKPNRHAFHDVGAATAALTLEALSRGLFVHQMAGFDAEKARAQFAIPEGFDPVAAVALGHPGEPAQLPPDLQARELAPRQRRPLAETAFFGAWGATGAT